MKRELSSHDVSKTTSLPHTNTVQTVGPLVAGSQRDLCTEMETMDLNWMPEPPGSVKNVSNGHQNHELRELNNFLDVFM